MTAVILMVFFTTLCFFVILRVKMRIPYSAAGRVAFTAGLITVPAGLGVIRLTGISHPASIAVALVAVYCLLLVGIMLLHFFRDPERKDPSIENGLVSPADGTVIYVKRIEACKVPVPEKKKRRMELTELTGTGGAVVSGYHVGIEMNILNVHVNRAPAAGRVTFQKHIPGRFLSLRDPYAPFRNERLSTVIETGRFSVTVIQIASRLVRRIVSYIDLEERVSRGQRIGMIKFGSQVDLIIPDVPGLTIAASAGDAVIAGETVIATYSRGL